MARWLCFAACGWLMAAGAAEAARPLPPAEKVEAAKRLVADTFRKELSADDKTPAVKALLETAAKTEGDDPAQAALFLAAAEVAARAVETKLAFEAVDRLAAAFDVDVLATKNTLLELAAKSAKTSDERQSVANRCLELADAALAAGRMEIADGVLKTAATSAGKLRDPEIRKQIAAKRRELEKARKQAERVESELADARKKLSANPNDPAANEALGKHLCFDGNDWTAGLKHLAKSSDAKLSKLAAADQKGAATGADAAALGDLWYALAESSDGARDQAGYRSRAAFWYTRAVQDLKGFAKTRIEKRLGELQDALAAAARQSGNENGKFIDITLAPGVLMRLVKIPASKDGKIKEFYLGQTEVTQRQWAAVMGGNPSERKGDNLPVELVTWNDCQQFIAALNREASAQRFAFRLPTVEEFTYCCEPVAKAAKSAGTLHKIGWLKQNAGDTTHAAGQLLASDSQLYDLIGNVWEWTSNDDKVFGVSYLDTHADNLVADGAKKYNKGPNLGLRIAADQR